MDLEKFEKLSALSKIDQKDLGEIVNIIGNWDPYLTTAGRVDLVKKAFDPATLRQVKPSLLYEGTPEQVALQTLITLQARGLGNVVAYLRTFKGELKDTEDETQLGKEIEPFITKYDAQLVEYNTALSEFRR